MKRLCVFLALVVFVGVNFLQAQNVQITGTVTSADDGLPIPGASVLVKGTSIGVATDIDGKYSLSVPQSATVLEFAFLGMVTQEVAIAGRTVIDVVLQSDATMLEEVVVTGYGVTRKAAFTGAATTVGTKEMEGKFNANPIKALEGNVAGLQMSTASGQPGAPSTIFIRGRNSLNSGTQPLYVIDGIPFTSSAQGMRSDEGQEFSPLATLNPADIESMTVLKDATATSIYGARAANGVIVITTKQGKQGALNVNFSARFGAEMMPVIPKNYRLLDAEKFNELSIESMLNNYKEYGESGDMDYYNYVYSDYYDVFGDGQGMRPYTKEGMKEFLYWWTPGVDGVDTNWLDEVTRTGFIQQYTVDVQSGGADKYAAKYFLSADYLENKAIIRGKDLTRYSFRFNLDQSISDFFTYGFNSSFAHTESNMGAGGGYFSDPITQAYMQAPIYPVNNEDGSWNFNTVNGYNPVAQRSELGDKSIAKQNRVVFSPNIKLNFTPDLFFVSRLGVDAYLTDEFGYWSFLQPQGKDMRGMGENGNNTNFLLTSTNTLNYIKTLNEKHKVNVLLGQEAQRNNTKFAYLSGSNYAVDYLNMVSLASVPGTATTSQDELILQSFFGNFQYDYANKYYFSSSLRVDGSSRFGENNYWAPFWSVGAKYRITEESFMESTEDWLTTLTLRASYGTTGNQTVGGSWYAARDLYDFGYNYNQRPGSAHLRFGNPDLSWEYTSKFNVGVDFTLLERITVTADYYDHQTKDMVFSVPVSGTTGLSSYSKNIGQLSNKGVEVSVNVAIVNTPDFNWNITMNGSHNKNKIVKLSTDQPIEYTTSIIEPGKDIYTFKMKEWAGVDPETGRGQWYLNETGNEKTFSYNAAAKRYVGSASPTFQGSFSNYISWRGVDFSFQLNTSLGGKIYGNNLRYDEQTGGSLGNNFTQWTYDNRWQKPGDIAKVPQLIALQNPAGQNSHSSRYLMSGDYLKIRSISLGYTLPKTIVQKMNVKSLRIFATADNVYTFSNSEYRGFDPSAIGADGVQWWNYPVPRTFTFGLTLGF